MQEEGKGSHPLEAAQRILENLPHRYPFIMIDRVLEVDRENKTIVAQKNLSFNEPVFQGHFPGAPLFPGVLMIEAIAQAGALWANMFEKREEIAALMSIRSAKFRKPAVPGDVLRICVSLLHLGAKGGKTAGKVYIGDELVAEAEMSFVYLKQTKGSES